MVNKQEETYYGDYLSHMFFKNGRPFLPTRHNMWRQPRALNNNSQSMAIVQDLREFDFQKATAESILNLTQCIVDYHKKQLPAIPLGFCGMISYSIALEPLSPRSLNPDDDQKQFLVGIPELFKELRFVGANTRDSDAPVSGQTRVALALGRLQANHHPNRAFQSHWVIMLDQTKLLWALYTKDVDSKNSYHLGTTYDEKFDSAFGADKVHERVVLLGSLDDIAFDDEKELRGVQVHALDWSTKSATFNKKNSEKDTNKRCASPDENTDLPHRSFKHLDDGKKHSAILTSGPDEPSNPAAANLEKSDGTTRKKKRLASSEMDVDLPHGTSKRQDDGKNHGNIWSHILDESNSDPTNASNIDAATKLGH